MSSLTSAKCKSILTWGLWTSYEEFAVPSGELEIDIEVSANLDVELETADIEVELDND